MTPKTGTATRKKLLNAAELLVNRQGFAATSVDQIIREAEVTKGTFFYHFKTKNDLARALIERYSLGDKRILTSNMERAETLSDDPLQQLLIFVGLLFETAEELDQETEPGCLFATYCYESGLFDEETKSVIEQAMRMWREVVGAKLHAAAKKNPPRLEVDLESLADMITVVLEGAFVMSRSVKGRSVFIDQLRHYRNYLQLLFNA